MIRKDNPYPCFMLADLFLYNFGRHQFEKYANQHCVDCNMLVFKISHDLVYIRIAVLKVERQLQYIYTLKNNDEFKISLFSDPCLLKGKYTHFCVGQLLSKSIRDQQLWEDLCCFVITVVWEAWQCCQGRRA